MSKEHVIRAALSVVVGFGALLAGHSQQVEKTKPEPESSVQTIALPQSTPALLPGPHVEIYRKNCLTCHSTRYVIMQPAFPQVVWEKEVKKMIDAYGAVIPEADQHEIVEYLVAVRGIPETK